MKSELYNKIKSHKIKIYEGETKKEKVQVLTLLTLLRRWCFLSLFVTFGEKKALLRGSISQSENGDV